MTFKFMAEDELFMVNVREARENGYEEVCSECGCGVWIDDADYHDSYCSRNPNVEKNKARRERWIQEHAR